jgi:hypothetical protein
MLFGHAWIFDTLGKPVVTDFLEVWVAGKTTLAGHAAAAYDPKLHYAAEAAAAGHGFHGHLWWHYPPQVLFLAALLARMPYPAAFFLWVGATGLGYTAAIWAIARSRAAAFAALGAPAVFLNAVCGQNGCLTAALMGAALIDLETRPILAGTCIGLLTYKPQLGLLFPFVLAASGRWRGFATAVLVALSGLIMSVIVFGAEPLRAFLHYLPLAGQTMLVENHRGWSKLQSLYALARFAGFTDGAAWVAQSAATVSSILALMWLWRRDVDIALKAAALPVAALLATPYLYMYDFPVLTIAIAFLYRHRAFDAIELGGIAVANLVILAYAFGLCAAPVGFIALVVAGSLVARRIWHESRASHASRRTAAGHHSEELRARV